MPHPSPRFSSEGGLEIEKTDSTTVKTIAEPYFLTSFNFYRTAILFFKDSDGYSSIDSSFFSKILSY